MAKVGVSIGWRDMAKVKGVEGEGGCFVAGGVEVNFVFFAQGAVGLFPIEDEKGLIITNDFFDKKKGAVGFPGSRSSVDCKVLGKFVFV